jgi:hypothetical protein
VIAPLTEIVFGIGLGFKRTRNLSVIILVCMHVFILSMIGPFGDYINAAVWPWNITFVAFLIILFWNKETILIKDIFQNRSIYHALIIILLGIMPVLSFWNMWPKYFSGALYSGNKIKSELYFSDQFKNDFSQELQNLIDNDKNRTSINNWTLSEANVATYPSEKYLLKFFENLCDSSQSEFDIIMILKSEPNIISGKRKESSYFCDELKGRHE